MSVMNLCLLNVVVNGSSKQRSQENCEIGLLESQRQVCIVHKDYHMFLFDSF